MDGLLNQDLEKHVHKQSTTDDADVQTDGTKHDRQNINGSDGNADQC